MSSKAETINPMQDTLKLLIALLIVLAAIAGFYYFADELVIYRVLGLMAGFGIAWFIALQTDKGRYYWGYFQDAQTEVRKVVWPSRQETVQTTLLVIIMVIIVAAFMWLMDMFLGWSIGALMGRGG